MEEFDRGGFGGMVRYVWKGPGQYEPTLAWWD